MVYCEDVKRNAKTSYMPLRGDEKFIDAVLNTRVSELERGVLERNYNQHSRYTHTASHGPVPRSTAAACG